MNRCRFIAVLGSVLLGTLLPSLLLVLPSPAAEPEPTYTVTLPGDQAVHLQIEETRTPDGKHVLHLSNRPKSIAKSDMMVDARMTLDNQNEPNAARLFLGADPTLGIYLEATRTGSSFEVREPAMEGDLPFSGNLISPLVSELFIGRQYDFKRGGPQNFAYLIDYATSTAKIDTLTLTADGEETITLPDGAVKARKLRYHLEESLLPETMRSGVFDVGPNGEVLKCDTAFFGVPLRAKGPATWEEGGKRLALRFSNPDNPEQIVLLHADRQFGGGSNWNVTAEIAQGPLTLATVSCDSRYQLIRSETPWHPGKKFVATVVGSQVHWALAAGPPQTVVPPEKQPVWFLLDWFFPSVWEGEGRAFAGMAVGDTRDGFFIPLFTGQRDGNSFTLERLADAAMKVSGASVSLHHYRYYGGGKTDDPAVEATRKAQGITFANYDIYTDGSRLVAFFSLDNAINIKIIRDGWESFAKTLAPVEPTAQ